MQKVINGVLTNYEVVGKGKKNMLVLHGWKGQIGDWMEIARRLGDRYKVYLLDLPGFGGSAKPKEDWGVYEYGEFVEKFLRAVGVKKAVVLGHSFGGKLGTLLAARTDLVEKLILVGAAGMEIKKLKARIIEMLKPLVRWLPQEVKNIFGSRDYREAGMMRKVLVRTVGQNSIEELGQISTPTLIVWGEKDGELPFKDARMLHGGIKGSVLRIVWGASHWPHVEKPENFMRILEEEGI